MMEWWLVSVASSSQVASRCKPLKRRNTLVAAPLLSHDRCITHCRLTPEHNLTDLNDVKQQLALRNRVGVLHLLNQHEHRRAGFGFQQAPVRLQVRRKYLAQLQSSMLAYISACIQTLTKPRSTCERLRFALLPPLLRRRGASPSSLAPPNMPRHLADSQ